MALSRAILFIFILFIFIAPQKAQNSSKNQSVQNIIEAVQQMLAARTTYSRMTIIVQSPRFNRTMELEAWTKGEKLGFLKILKPEKNRGITFLKNGSEVWQYIPNIDKTIRIPPSMMLQAWMGSDLTNDDMVQESSMLDDYDKTIVSQNDQHWVIELTPRENAPVVWGKLTVTVSKKNILPAKTLYYDDAGELIREIAYSDVQYFEGRAIPTTWTITPKTPEKKGYSTTLQIQKITFNLPLKDSFFTKRNLILQSK